MRRRLAMLDVHDLGAESLVTTRRVVGGRHDLRSLCRGTSQQRARLRAKSTVSKTAEGPVQASRGSSVVAGRHELDGWIPSRRDEGQALG